MERVRGKSWERRGEKGRWRKRVEEAVEGESEVREGERKKRRKNLQPGNMPASKTPRKNLAANKPEKLWVRPWSSVARPKRNTQIETTASEPIRGELSK